MAKRERESCAPDGAEAQFALKEMVVVQARTHPGFNKPGGAGKITKVNYEKGCEKPLTDGSREGKRTSDYTYNIKYILGGTEKRVDAQWITSKNPLAVDRAELSAKRAKHNQEVKEAKRAEEEARLAREMEEKRKRREKARESSLAMVKKIREQLKMKKAGGKRPGSKAGKKKGQVERREDVQTENNSVNALEPVKMYFSDEDSEECIIQEEPVVELSESDKETVKNVMAALTAIESKCRTGEVELEKLKENLSLAEPKTVSDEEIETALSHLQYENKIMYREEVIWII